MSRVISLGAWLLPSLWRCADKLDSEKKEGEERVIILGEMHRVRVDAESKGISSHDHRYMMISDTGEATRKRRAAIRDINPRFIK